MAELVTITGPADLHLAIRKVEEIEMARNLASGGQARTEDSESVLRQRQVLEGKRPVQCSANSESWSAAKCPNATISAICSTVSPIHQSRQGKPMPNAIIAAGMATIIGNAHLHHKQDSEVEDVAVVDGITEDDVDDEEEDVVGDSRVPKEIQCMLL